jgi:hypothetical protein
MNDIAVQAPASGVQQQLAELDRQIAAAMRKLSPRLRAFLRARLTETSITSAAVKAGYSPRSARNNAHRLMARDGVCKAWELLSLKDQLQHGLKPASKRAILANIAEIHAVEQPRAAVAAVTELNRMDGHHKPIQTHSIQETSISISYDLKLPARPGAVIDGELSGDGSGQDTAVVAIANDTDDA